MNFYDKLESIVGKNASIRSKLPTDLNMELHLPVEAKEKLAIILFCGFSFPCFNAIMMRFDMTFDDKLRDGSGFGKLTNSLY